MGRSGGVRQAVGSTTAHRARIRHALAPVTAVVLALMASSCSTSSGGGSTPVSGAVTGPAPTSVATDDSISASGPDGAPVTALTVRWVASLTGPSNEDEIDGVAVGADGSVFVTGKFERSTVLAGEELRSAGRADIPVARLRPDGAPLWVRRFGGPGEDNLFDIAARDGGAVASGWFEDSVAFGDTTLTSAGSTDCVVVALDGDGNVEWARSFGGPGADGCNEVVVARDGSITTTIDTQGGWEAADGAVPAQARADSVVMRLDPTGATEWTRPLGGPNRQRAKAVAVADDGSVFVGGDTVGELVVDGSTYAPPGRAADAWLAHWTADGDLEWVRVWGGAGDDLVKGVAVDGTSVHAVGPFEGAIDLAGVALDAGDSTDLAVARFGPDGSPDWVTSVAADEALSGAEVVRAADGGVLFGSWLAPGLRLRSPSGDATTVDAANGGTAWLAHYRPDGSVGMATTIEGTAGGGPDEIDRVGDRVYLDLVVRGTDTVGAGTRIEADGKDGSLWALDLPAPAPTG
jgi:hypothetical protein